ncbi:hypothetical protein BT96DRAFT_1021850 [Gymnopus androsaceus JB14]|uniref:Uncharacterized protein n=2 Tax=Gymnopus androsaceus JB14 TaxID=1447944 RepID=A0A6A4HBH3_9AGAR|nr:hypothetical protein BT96DRAFT_1021850 [Gymnopus androsaceus JB14]
MASSALFFANASGFKIEGGRFINNPTAPKDVEMEDIDDHEAQAKKKAEALNQAGSDAYRRKEFEQAAKNYQQAWDTWPKGITFLTNLGAVYFEQGKYDEAIETYEKAVEEGQSLRADFKLVAKAYGRVGSAYQKKGDLSSAIKYYEKSLTERRTPNILNKLREAEKLRDAEADRNAYIDAFTSPNLWSDNPYSTPSNSLFERYPSSSSSCITPPPLMRDEDSVKRSETAFTLFEHKFCEEHQTESSIGGQTDLSPTQTLTSKEMEYWEKLAKEKEKEHAHGEARNGTRARSKIETTMMTEISPPVDLENMLAPPRQHGRSASAPTPPIPYESIQIPNLYPSSPSCPTSSLLPMINKDNGNPEDAMSDFDIMPNENHDSSTPEDDMCDAFVDEEEYLNVHDSEKDVDDDFEDEAENEPCPQPSLPGAFFSGSQNPTFNGCKFHAVNGDKHTTINNKPTYNVYNNIYPGNDSSPLVPSNPPATPCNPTFSRKRCPRRPRSRWSITTFTHMVYHHYLPAVMYYPMVWTGYFAPIFVPTCPWP